MTRLPDLPLYVDLACYGAAVFVLLAGELHRRTAWKETSSFISEGERLLLDMGQARIEGRSAAVAACADQLGASIRQGKRSAAQWIRAYTRVYRPVSRTLLAMSLIISGIRVWNAI